MIVLLNCSTSLFANNDILPTGDVDSRNDSVLIAYDDLRIVNSKLIELEYEKEININLRKVIHNDSIIIKDYTYLNDKLNKDYKRTIKQRNVCFGVSILMIVIGSTFILLK